MTSMFGLDFASLCSYSFPPISVEGQRFMPKIGKVSVIFKFTGPICINAKNSVERSDFVLLYVFFQCFIVGLCD